MSVRNIVYLLLLCSMAVSCEKVRMSKIPEISLISFGPEVIRVNYDAPVLSFNLKDGDGDLGNSPLTGRYDIYIRDMRFDTGYAGHYFPEINPGIPNAAETGITGVCSFVFEPYLLLPRIDSIHATIADTVYFEVYIMDKAGNSSNHLLTPSIIMVP